MARRISLLWSFLLLTAVTVGAQDADQQPPPSSFDYGRFGSIPVVRPAGEPAAVALLLSGDQGLGPHEAEIAAALADGGAVVLEIDTPHYLTAVSAGKVRSIDPAGDLEGLSQFGQMQLGLPTYQPPILAGIGTGSTLAYAALAEAPPGTFSGAVSLGFCPVFQGAKTIYHGDGLRWDRDWKGPGWRLLPDRNLASPWIEIESPVQSSSSCPVAPAPDFAAAMASATRIELPAGLTPEAEQEAWKGQLRQALSLIAAKREETARGRIPDLADLPLIEVAANGPESDVLVVDISGSGGWEGFDVALGKAFANRGVPTVGVSSLDYFWKARDPEGAARDLARILDHFLAAWHKSTAVVIGYSQGADVVPFMVNRLPAVQRSHVAVVGLIGPDGEAEFDLGRGAFMRRRHVAKPLPVAPEIPRVRGPKLVCVYGKREPAPLCPHLGPKLKADIVLVAGGHGFRGDAPTVVDHLLAAAGMAPQQAPLTASKAHRTPAPKRATRSPKAHHG